MTEHTHSYFEKVEAKLTYLQSVVDVHEDLLHDRKRDIERLEEKVESLEISLRKLILSVKNLLEAVRLLAEEEEEE